MDGLMIAFEPAATGAVAADPWREFRDAAGEADRPPPARRAPVATVRAAGGRYGAALQAGPEDGTGR
jgi:hypothetical protein